MAASGATRFLILKQTLGWPLHIYWSKGATNLTATVWSSEANQSDHVILAVYNGDIWLNAHYGYTIIDGSHIKTGSITANQIQAGAITAQQLSVNAIAAQHIQANAITSEKIAANSIHGDRIITNTIHGEKIWTNSIHGEKIWGSSIHGDKISAGTLNADRISAGTITATHIKAETIEAGNIQPNAITQTLVGQGTAGGGVSLGLNFQQGSILIMVSVSGSLIGDHNNIARVYLYRDDALLGPWPYIDVPMVSVQGLYSETVWTGTLIHNDNPNFGWHTYGFKAYPPDQGTQATRNATKINAIIMNYKR